MKEINLFTSEILDKVKRQRQKRNIRRIAVSSFSCCVLIFLVLFSNIIPLDSFDFAKYAYRMYKGVYADEREETIFSFTNNSNAVLCVDSVPYSLTTKSNTKKEFNFNAEKMQTEAAETEETSEFFDTTAIKIEFYDGGAIIRGNFYGLDLSIDVKIMPNTKMESGVWKRFNKDNVDAEWIDSYFVVNEKGETYYIHDADLSYEVLFVSVFGSEYTVLLDNYGVPANFIQLTRIERSVYGIDAIKLTSYIDGTELYFKLLESSDRLDYSGGEFSANFIKAKKRVDCLGKNDSAKYLPIKWRLFPEESFSTRLTDYTATLDLSSDKTVIFTVRDGSKSYSYGGTWTTTDENVIVILDGYSLFGKIFTVYQENDDGKSFGESAISTIKIGDGFKVGYHDFTYYLTVTDYRIYWGSDYDIETVSNELKYETEYVLNGYYYKYYYDRTLPFGYDTE
ncbi:MAG: hypothetical protein J5697_01430, partial [Clostridia bacterium]|nr:hypothetical protein [Clostridia bacterium]